MVLYTSKFCSIESDASTSVIRQNWFAETTNMTDAEFKIEQLKLADLIRIHKPKSIHTDALTFGYVIAPDIQEWNAKEVLGPFVSLGGKKVGMLIPPDIFAQVSIQQAMDEVNAYETRYFENEKELISWLKN